MSHDVERIRTEAGYNVECVMCGTWFEATRYDASYCSSTCRSRYHRAQKQVDKRIERGKNAVGTLINHLPNTGESKTYIALLELSRSIAYALSQVNTDTEGD